MRFPEETLEERTCFDPGKLYQKCEGEQPAKKPKEALVLILTANLEEPEPDVCRNVKSGATGRIIGSNESTLQSG